MPSLSKSLAGHVRDVDPARLDAPHDALHDGVVRESGQQGGEEIPVAQPPPPSKNAAEEGASRSS